MNILRGTGLAGLSGMQAVSNLPISQAGESALLLFRPLIGFHRDEVLSYLTDRGVPFREDSSNFESRFTRNRIRNELLPLLAREYNPGIKAHLTNLARIAHTDDDYIERAVDEAWNDVAQLDREATAIEFDLARFADLHRAVQMRVIRRAVAELNGSTRDLDFATTHRALTLLTSDSQGEMHLRSDLLVGKWEYWSGLHRVGSPVPILVAVARYGKVWPLLDNSQRVVVSPDKANSLIDGWVCEVDCIEAGSVEYGDYMAAFDLSDIGGTRLLLRTRLPGDRISPIGIDGSKGLKALFIDARIPRIIRDRVALVVHPETHEVLWVPGPGGRRSSVAAVKPGDRQVLRVRFVRRLQESDPGV
jgi:tRNA(Ile)-lysidine synthase